MGIRSAGDLILDVRPPSYEFLALGNSLLTDFSWIDSTINVAAILLGALIVKWQVRQNAREQLRLQIYHEISRISHELMLAETKATSFVNDVSMKLRLLQDPALQALLPSYQELRASKFTDLDYAVSSAAINVITVLEKYEIACPELKIFRTAINVVGSDVQKSHRKIFGEYLKAFSVEVQTSGPTSIETTVIHKPIPTGENLERIQAVASEYVDAISRYGEISFDLDVESQNLLLGGLFDYRVPRRTPGDPNKIVITLDRTKAENLMRYFENETDWGKEKKEIEKRVKEMHPRSDD